MVLVSSSFGAEAMRAPLRHILEASAIGAIRQEPICSLACPAPRAIVIWGVRWGGYMGGSGRDLTVLERWLQTFPAHSTFLYD